MAIELVDDIIKVTGDETYSMADIASAVDEVTEIAAGVYSVSASIHMGSEEGDTDDDGNPIVTRLVSKNEVILFGGEELLIGKWCILRLGDMLYDESTANGSVLIGDNITRFGGGGDLYAYNSKIKMWCSWEFDNGVTQKVELVDCLVDGYGRLEGVSSKLVRVAMERSSGDYGGFLTIGDMKEQRDVVIGMSERLGDEVAVLLDGNIGGKLVDCEFREYGTLVKVVSDGTEKIEFIDCQFGSGYTVKLADEVTVANIELSYSFTPTLVAIDSTPIAGAKVEIIGEYGTVSCTSGNNGEVELQVMYGRYNGEEIVFNNQYKLVCWVNGVMMTRELVMNGSVKDAVLYMTDDRLDEDRYDLEWVVDRLNKIEPIVNGLEDGVMQTLCAVSTRSNFTIANKNGIEVVI